MTYTIAEPCVDLEDAACVTGTRHGPLDLAAWSFPRRLTMVPVAIHCLVKPPNTARPSDTVAAHIGSAPRAISSDFLKPSVDTAWTERT